MALGKTPTPVRLYVDDDARLPKRLAHLLQDRIDSLTDTIVGGNMPFEKYNELTGWVRGLREALQMAEDLSKELE